MSFGGQTPAIIVLKEGEDHYSELYCLAWALGLMQLLGTDASQGKGQIVSNINACLAVQDTVRTTLGPYGGDLMLVDDKGKQTITTDGATVMKVGRPGGCSRCSKPQLMHDSFLILFTLLLES